MYQVLFTVPLSSIHESLPDLPIYGYGTMLFLAFVFTLFLAIRLCRREGIRKEVMQDLAVWLFVSGILGARVMFFLQPDVHLASIGQFFAIWDGGLVFYGSIFGGAIGYILAHFIFLRKHGVSPWKMADVLAPCLALGLCLGRVGCLLNGCCYGNVACLHCPDVHFPMAAAPRLDMTQRGYQTAAGFTFEARTDGAPVVGKIEPGSAAEEVLKSGDRILNVQLKDAKPSETDSRDSLSAALTAQWPRGQNEVRLTVERTARDNTKAQVPVAFEPRTIGLHPTQIYETISAGLLTFLLLSYYPFKRRDAMVMVMAMLCYGVHRFLNEMLRTDTQPVALGLTLSQNISLLVLAGGVILWLMVLARPAHPEPPPAPA